MPPYVAGWLAASLGAVPLAWLSGLHARGRSRGAEWWWLAAAFAVSFAADVAASFLVPPDRLAVSAAYPLSQAAIVAFVFLERRDAAYLLGALLVVAVIAVIWRGVSSPDVLFRTIAWGASAGIVVDRPIGRLQWALLVTFMGCLLCWWGYALWPGWMSWIVYQSSRAVGIGLFCWAAMKPGPRLRAA